MLLLLLLLLRLGLRLLGRGRSKSIAGWEDVGLSRDAGWNRQSVGAGTGADRRESVGVCTDRAHEAIDGNVGPGALVTERGLAGFNLVRGLLSARWAAATLVALDLSLDATTIGSGADGRQVWADGLNQAALHGWVGVVESGLDDIVGKRVPKESVKLSRLQHLIDQHVLRRLLSATEALLNDVGAELLLRELGHAALELGNQRLGEDGLVQIEDVLNNIVAEWILDQGIGIVRDLSDEPSLLVSRSMVNAALEHAATMTMSANINTVVSNGIKDELGIGRSKLVEALLDHVVAVQVLDQLHNSITKSRDNGLDLTRGRNEFDHLLQSSSSVLVESNSDEVLGRILNENSALFVVAELEELLAEVVAEGIGHQLNDMLIGLKPYHVDLLGVALLQLLLKISAAVLILAEGIDLATQLLKWQVCKTVHG